jgi:stage II sporulation SpoAA-like protein
MISISTDGNILYTIVSEKITREDFPGLESTLDTLFTSFSKLRWYYEMQHFDGWEFKTFFHASRYTLKHNDRFEKIAMVGKKKWQEWLTDLMKPFTSAAVRYFDLEDKEKARKWIVG